MDGTTAEVKNFKDELIKELKKALKVDEPGSEIKFSPLQRIQDNIFEIYRRNHSKFRRLFLEDGECDIADYFVELNITQDRQEKTILTTDRATGAKPDSAFVSTLEDNHARFNQLFTDPTGLIRPEDIENAASAHLRRIVILGGPGIGKSTFCQKVAHQAATGGSWFSHYKLVIWIRLHEWANTKKDGKEISLQEYIYDHYSKKDKLLADSLDEFKAALTDHNHLVLYVLDGLDEIHSLRTDGSVFQRDLKTIIDYSHFLLTSRRGFTHEIEGSLKLSIRGLTDKHIETYITNYFKVMRNTNALAASGGTGLALTSLSSAITSIDHAAKLIQFLNNPSHSMLKGLAHVPMLLDLICLLAKMGRLSNELKTVTKLYGELPKYVKEIYADKPVIKKNFEGLRPEQKEQHY